MFYQSNRHLRNVNVRVRAVWPETRWRVKKIKQSTENVKDFRFSATAGSWSIWTKQMISKKALSLFATMNDSLQIQTKQSFPYYQGRKDSRGDFWILDSQFVWRSVSILLRCFTNGTWFYLPETNVNNGLATRDHLPFEKYVCVLSIWNIFAYTTAQ